jgi:ABC-type branched-subunit amino acid transport system substrate-binding protein
MERLNEEIAISTLRVSKRRTQALAVAGLGAVLALSACGSSSSSASNDSTTTPASVSGGSSSSSISAKILVVGDFTSSIPFTVPEIVPTVKGVLRGFPNVQIESCDSKGLPAAYIVCEHKAVSDHVAAVIQGFNPAQSDTVLTQTGIPILDTTDTTSATSFPVSEAYSQYVAMGYALASTGCTKLGILYLDGSDFLADLIKKGFVAKGGTEAARAAVAANAADLSPAVSKLTGAGAGCVAVSLAPAGAAQALTALKQSGKTLTIGGISAVFSAQVLSSLGSLTNGLLVVDSQLNLADPAPGIQQVAADEKAESSSAPVTQQSISAWVGARLVAAALPKIQGAVTASSMLAALNGLRNVDMDGVIQPYSAVGLSNPAYTRLFNHYGINYKIENGKPVPDGGFYDVGPILAAK